MRGVAGGWVDVCDAVEFEICVGNTDGTGDRITKCARLRSLYASFVTGPVVIP